MTPAEQVKAWDRHERRVQAQARGYWGQRMKAPPQEARGDLTTTTLERRRAFWWGTILGVGVGMILSALYLG